MGWTIPGTTARVIPSRRTLIGAIALTVGLLACGTPASGPSQGAASPTASRAADAGSQSPAASAAQAGGGTGDPCALLTEQEATTALGSDPGAGVLSQPTVCTFGSASQGGILSVSIPIASGYDFAALRTRAQQKAASHGGTFRDLSGIGDQAFAASEQAFAALLFVKGGRYVQVLVSGAGSGTDLLDVVKTLGIAASARL